MSERWLRCFVTKGVFRDEWVVRVRLAGTERSLFVPRDKVRITRTGDPESEGSIAVKVFSEGPKIFALLPSESDMVVPVTEADLVTA